MGSVEGATSATTRGMQLAGLRGRLHRPGCASVSIKVALISVMLAGASWALIPGSLSGRLPASSAAFVNSAGALASGTDEGPNGGMPWKPFVYPNTEEMRQFAQRWAKAAPHLARADTCQRRFGLPAFGKCGMRDGVKVKCEQPFLVITHWASWAGYGRAASASATTWSSSSNDSAAEAFRQGLPGRGAPLASAASLERPHILISGSVHGDEQVGPVASLALAELLLANYLEAERWQAQCGAAGGPACQRQQRRLQRSLRMSTMASGSGQATGAAFAQQVEADAARSASAGLPFNPWLKLLVETRVLVLLPTANPDGYHNMRRGEMLTTSSGRQQEVDPNRDFAYDPEDGAAGCMRTITARCVNELFREHLFQGMVTFHGGDQSVTYEWGTDRHTDSHSASPDDVAQAASAVAMSAFGGAFPEGQPYPTGRMNSVMYPVQGGLEDWSYAASWDTTYNVQCQPDTYGGYDASRTAYGTAELRCSTMLVETNNAKRPDAKQLGYWGPALLAPAKSGARISSTGPATQTDALPQGVDAGDVPRNVRLALSHLDLARPYAVALSVATVDQPAPPGETPAGSAMDRPVALFGPAGSASIQGPESLRSEYHQWRTITGESDADSIAVDIEWDVGGAAVADSTGLVAFRWPISVPPSLLLLATGTAFPPGSAAGKAANRSFSQPEAAESIDSASLAGGSLPSWAGVMRGFAEAGSAALPAGLGATVVAADAAAAIAAAAVSDSMSAAGATDLPPDAWSILLPAELSVAAAVQAARGSSNGSAPRPAVTNDSQAGRRRAVGPVAAPLAVAKSRPARWSRSTKDASAAPFVAAFSARVSLPPLSAGHLADVGCIVPTERGGGQARLSLCPDGSAAAAAYVVIPWVKADAAWSPPGTEPQTHLSRVRTDPHWLKSTNGFVARGQRYFTGSAVFVGVVDRRPARLQSAWQAVSELSNAASLPAPTPLPSAAPSSSASPLPSPSATASAAPPAPSASVSPATPTASPSPSGCASGAAGTGGDAPLVPGTPPRCSGDDASGASSPGQSADDRAAVFGVPVSAETAAALAQAALSMLVAIGCWRCCVSGRVCCGRRCPGGSALQAPAGAPSAAGAGGDSGAQEPLWCAARRRDGSVMGPLDWAVSLCFGEGGLVQRIRGAPVYEPASALPDDDLDGSDHDVGGAAAGSLGSPSSDASSFQGVELVGGAAVPGPRVQPVPGTGGERAPHQAATLSSEPAFRDSSDSDGV